MTSVGMRASHVLALSIIVVCAVCSVARVAAKAPSQRPSLDPLLGQFIDETGRYRLLHGVNVVYKVAPYIPQRSEFSPSTSLTDAEIAQLKQLGQTVVRLGVMWAGVEPQPGVFNGTYVSAMKDLVTSLYAHGIYTILDCHQDLFSERFCGDGAPSWVADLAPSAAQFPQPLQKDPYPVQKDGDPGWQNCSSKAWPDYYASKAVSQAFQQLYTKGSAINSAFVRYWEHVATAFRDTPGVLAYEVLNEPWLGDIYAHPSLLIPGRADRTELGAFYSQMHDVIRKVDADTILMMEPIAFDWLYFGRSGLKELPGSASRTALAYHIYCQPQKYQDEQKAWARAVCTMEDERLIHERLQDAQSIGVGGILTEFGAVGNTTAGAESISLIARLADEHLQSWTYWQFKTFGEPDADTSGDVNVLGLYDANTGAFEATKARALARPHLAASPGPIQKSSFDDATRILSVEYLVPEGASAPALLYASDLVYNSGFHVNVTVAGTSWRTVATGSWIEVQHAPGFDGEMSLQIYPA